MNNIQNLLYSPEIKEKLQVKSKDIQLEPAKKEKLAKAYFKMYFGLSCMNWTQDKKMGTAWQSAIGQMEDYIKSKAPKSPATQFLQLVHNEHKVNWPKHIMTHPQRDTTLAAAPDEKKQWRAYAQNQIQSALAEITMITNQVHVKPDADKPKESVPQTQNDKAAPAKPAVNSGTPPAQQPGTNSPQTTAHQTNPQLAPAKEEEVKRAAMAKTGVQPDINTAQAKDLMARADLQKNSNRADEAKRINDMQRMQQMQIWIIQQKMQHAA